MSLDVGGQRIGVAVANSVARIAHPEAVLSNDHTTIRELQRLIDEHEVAVLVLGLPRGLEGQHTQQTSTVEFFAQILKQYIDLPFYWQDEAVTSKKAIAELQARGIKYEKGDIDALAATYILEDFLKDHPEIKA